MSVPYIRRVYRALIALLVCAFSAGSSLALPPLHEAARQGNLAEVQRLLALNPKQLNEVDDDGNNAIHWAIAQGQLPIVQYLLDAGVSPTIAKTDVAAKNGDKGWTPLHQAAGSGQADILSLLLRYPVDLNARDQNDQTPLHTAVWHNRVDCARLLIEAGTPVNLRRKDKVFPLEIASYFGYVDMGRMLLEKGAETNGRVYEGNAPLHQTARQGHFPFMQLLAQFGADLNVRRDDEQTPLHVAAAAGQTNTTFCLLSLGADANAVMKDGATPLALAQKAGQQGTAGLLQFFLAAVNDTKTALATREALLKTLPNKPVLDRVVYRNDFTAPAPGDEWTTTPTGAHHAPLRLTEIPGTGKKFLGEFGDQNVRLTLTKLPPHARVTVSLTLFVINTWDGNGMTPIDGPDIWEASVQDGPLLYRGTFANSAPDWNKIPIQSYPGEWPLEFQPGRTGAVANDLLKLGATPQNPKGKPDAVYRMKFTFAHDRPFLMLNFTGKGLQELSDESWGIRSIEVQVGTLAPSARKKPAR